MKKLTREEFNERLRYTVRKLFTDAQRRDRIKRAKKIFNNLTDNNISDSFEIYNEMLAEFEWEKEHRTSIHGRKLRDYMDYMVKRPRCPECGSELRLAEVNTFEGDRIEEDPDAKTFWMCPRMECGYESQFYKESINDWLKKLPQRETDAELKINAERRRLISEYLPECPECGYHPWELKVVKTPKGKSNRFGWKSVFRCASCGHEKYYKETHGTIMKQLVEKKNKEK